MPDGVAGDLMYEFDWHIVESSAVPTEVDVRWNLLHPILPLLLYTSFSFPSFQSMLS